MPSFKGTITGIALAFVAAVLVARLLRAVIQRKLGALDVATPRAVRRCRAGRRVSSGR